MRAEITYKNGDKEVLKGITDYFNIDEYTHFYIEYRGKFFDAECPYGVKDYYKLPTFKREKIGIDK